MLRGLGLGIHLTRVAENENTHWLVFLRSKAHWKPFCPFGPWSCMQTKAYWCQASSSSAAHSLPGHIHSGCWSGKPRKQNVPMLALKISLSQCYCHCHHHCVDLRLEFPSDVTLLLTTISFCIEDGDSFCHPSAIQYIITRFTHEGNLTYMYGSSLRLIGPQISGRFRRVHACTGACTFSVHVHVNSYSWYNVHAVHVIFWPPMFIYFKYYVSSCVDVIDVRESYM